MPPDLPEGAGGPSDSLRDAEWIDAWIASTWRRWRLWYAAWALVLGAGVALLLRALLLPLTTTSAAACLALGLAVAVVAWWRAPGVRDVTVLVRAVERANPDLQNALFTWHECQEGAGLGEPALPSKELARPSGESTLSRRAMATGPRSLSPAIAARLVAHSRGVLRDAAPIVVVSHGTWAIALAAIVLGLVGGFITPMTSRPADAQEPVATSNPDPVAAGALSWAVVVTPPSYAGKPIERHEHPSRVDVLEGSRVDVTFTTWPDGATAFIGDGPLALREDGDTRTARLTATTSDVVIVKNRDDAVLVAMTLVVVRDAPPGVRITAPGADLRRDAATGSVTIRVTARDDMAVRGLRLLYTKVSGSGESFSFEDGEWPLRIERRSVAEWEGTHTVDLATLNLAPGDSVAYHAVAHDARFGAAGTSESERFLIEIVRQGAVPAGDYSLPEPELGFALSQRMVIQLTEGLLQRQARIARQEFREDAQTLAVAQRRVRAEFVFLLGGEVVDEVEEAGHSHEIGEGRLDNQGKSDLTEAVRHMAQAEVRLTNADVREALEYEYKALASLQAAFGKARYFMRTLPIPVQLDMNRRLTGERVDAASSRWTARPFPDAARTDAIALLARLDAPGVDVTGLLPALVALDRRDGAWVAAVQRAAQEEGTDGVARILRARVLPASPTWLSMPLPRSATEGALGGVSRPSPARRGTP